MEIKNQFIARYSNGLKINFMFRNNFFRIMFMINKDGMNHSAFQLKFKVFQMIFIINQDWINHSGCF